MKNKFEFKKAKILFFTSCFLNLVIISGCATYKIQESSKHGGYVYSRSANIMLEYTADENNKAPSDKELAKARFKRRWKNVEYYYRNMGHIQGVASSYWGYIRIFLFSPLLSPFIIPIHIVQQYKYQHNPEYKTMVDEIEDKQERMRREKIEKFAGELKNYIKEDMLREEGEL